LNDNTLHFFRQSLTKKKAFAKTKNLLGIDNRPERNTFSKNLILCPNPSSLRKSSIFHKL